MKLTIQDKLYKKLWDEYYTFLEELKTESPDEIIDRCYEKVFKEDIMLCFEHGEINDENIKTLAKHNYTLDDLYNDWLKYDVSYMDMLSDCIDSTVEKLKKCNPPKRKPSLEEKLQAANEKVKAQEAQKNNNKKSRNRVEREN